MSTNIFGLSVPPRCMLVTTVLCCAMLSIFLFPSETVAQQTHLYTAGGYGAYAFLGGTVDVPKSAVSGIGPGCGTARVGSSAVGSASSVSAEPFVNTAVTSTSALSSNETVSGSADAHSINVLRGAITADEIVMASTSFLDSHGVLRTSTSGSNLVNLVVGGKPIASMPTPNTTMSLPGFGRVVLNQQITFSGLSRIELTVNMIHVYVTVENSLGVAVGTEIIVAEAYSGLIVIPGPAELEGNALGSSIISSTTNSRPSAVLSVGCGATKPKTVTLSGLNVP